MFGTPLENNNSLASVVSDDIVIPTLQNNSLASIDDISLNTEQGEVLSSTTMFNASKYIALLLGVFLVLLLAVDGYYAKLKRSRKSFWSYFVSYTFIKFCLNGYLVYEYWSYFIVWSRI